jgi:hypothetical protein
MTTGQSMLGQINGNTFYMAGASQTTRIGVSSHGAGGTAAANNVIIGNQCVVATTCVFVLPPLIMVRHLATSHIKGV